MRIAGVERILVDVPFHEIPERNMARYLAGWHISEVCRVTSDTGLVGYGETLPNYTWGRVSDAAVERVKGRSDIELATDFLQHVTGVEPTEAQSDVLSSVMDEGTTKRDHQAA